MAEGEDPAPGERGETASALSKVLEIVAGWWRVFDAHVADILGLNQSRYQWVVDEYFNKKEEEERERIQQEARLHVQLSKLEQGQSNPSQ